MTQILVNLMGILCLVASIALIAGSLGLIWLSIRWRKIVGYWAVAASIIVICIPMNSVGICFGCLGLMFFGYLP